ncbi:hypothetical protein BMF35_a1887 [Aurantiacibacter gangjinensis]|nr:hypothetical protein BMF35_a1887 [Aurantiacibacter gangjinensis]
MRYLRFCAIGYAIAAAVGVASGFLSDQFESGAIAGWVIVALWVLAVAGFAWFSVEYFRRVDELEIAHQLWAGTIALYVYLFGAPSIWFFEDIGLLIGVPHYAIYLVTGATFILVYGWRRLGLR